MATRHLKELKPGMVLAEPVRTAQGMLLLNRGATLTAKHLWVLKTWGVARVAVEGEDEDASADGANRLAPDHERERVARLRRRFPDMTGDEPMQAIFEAALRGLRRKELARDARTP